MEGEASSLPAAYGRELAAGGSGPVKANESIRVAVKAVIIQDGKLLVTKNTDPWGDFYLLPGGGQEPGETLSDTLRREALKPLLQSQAAALESAACQENVDLGSDVIYLGDVN